MSNREKIETDVAEFCKINKKTIDQITEIDIDQIINSFPDNDVPKEKLKEYINNFITWAKSMSWK